MPAGFEANHNGEANAARAAPVGPAVRACCNLRGTRSVAVELIEPTPDAALNRALLDTLRKWRFFPALEGGKPKASTIEIWIPISVR